MPQTFTQAVAPVYQGSGLWDTTLTGGFERSMRAAVLGGGCWLTTLGASERAGGVVGNWVCLGQAHSIAQPNGHGLAIFSTLYKALGVMLALALGLGVGFAFA